MGNNIAKEASAQKILSKSIKELSENLSKSGYKVKGGVDQFIKNETKGDFGLVGLAGSGVKGLAKSVKKGVDKVAPESVSNGLNKAIEKTKPVQDKLSNARQKMDTAIADLDMKGGAIGHKYAPGKSKDLFVKNKKVELEGTDALGNKMFAEHKITSASEPLKKARNVAVPVAGGMYLADKMEKLKYDPNKEGQGDLNKSAETKDEVIDKLANMIQNDNVHSNQKLSRESYLAKRAEEKECFEQMVKLASEASEVLKIVSAERFEFMEKIARLEEEKEEMARQMLLMKRQDRSEKLADEMLEKGMLKQSNYQDKVSELNNLDDDSFNLLKSTVDSVGLYKSASEYGLDSLEYIVGGETEEVVKPTMLTYFANDLN